MFVKDSVANFSEVCYAVFLTYYSVIGQPIVRKVLLQNADVRVCS